MNRILKVHLATFLILGSSGGFASTPNEESADFLKRCLSQREGAFKLFSTTVMAIDSLVKGEGKTNPFCLHDTACFMTKENPVGIRGNMLCRFMDGRCQTLAECSRTMREPTEYGFGKSQPSTKSAYIPKTARRCTEVGFKEKSIIYADYVNAKKTSEYKAVCTKSLKCVLPNNSREILSGIYCPTKGREMFRDANGTLMEYDTCPGADECFDTQIPLPTEQQFIQNMRLVRAQAINETFPHKSNSDSAIPASPVNATTHNQSIDPL